MYYTYILFSEKLDRYYVGSTQNLEERMHRHNSGRSKYTKVGIPWRLVYFEEHENKSEACKREYYIKLQKSRKFIEGLIGNKY